jgi:hypothetical protein
VRKAAKQNSGSAAAGSMDDLCAQIGDARGVVFAMSTPGTIVGHVAAVCGFCGVTCSVRACFTEQHARTHEQPACCRSGISRSNRTCAATEVL